MVEDISLLEMVDVRIAEERGVPTVGVPIGTGECVVERAVKVMRDGGAGLLVRCLADMPDKQAAVLITNEPLGQRPNCLERVLGTSLNFARCRRADYKAQWAYERIIKLPVAAEAHSFFQEVCQG